jgi:hypothetical protein
MKATKQESVKIILELSKEEAETLKDMVQNALVENESQQCEVFRMVFGLCRLGYHSRSKN